MTKLFELIELRDLVIRNRAWLPPMCQYSVDRRDGIPTHWHLVHLGSRAAGGFGMVIAEATAVREDGRISPEDTGLWNDEQMRAWDPIVRFVHERGAAIGIQLGHAGAKASTYRPFPGAPSGYAPPDDGGWRVVGVSNDPVLGLGRPRKLAIEEIASLVEDFRAAARRALHAGFDAIELHGAHGYLIHQFLSPLTNDRTDRYGGSFANRCRFVLEIVDAVREVWPTSHPLFVRLSAIDWTTGGWTLEESVSLARELRQRGADLIDVSTGGLDSGTIPAAPGYQIPFSRAIRDQSGIATAAVGLITTAADAESILQSGAADAVLVGRAALRQPSWPLEAARDLAYPHAESLYQPQYFRGAWPAASIPSSR